MTGLALGASDLDERTKVELPFVETLLRLGWSHIEGDTEVPAFTERDDFRQVLLKGRLRKAIRDINLDEAGEPWLDDGRIDQALLALERLHVPGGLVAMNRAATNMLLQGVPVDGDEAHGGRDVPVQFIDFEHPERNDFLAINQFRVDPTADRPSIIPDIVLFVNGIPLGVVEAKAPTVTEPLEKGITQLLRYSNQRGADTEEGVEKLFHFNAVMISTCFYEARMCAVGGKYEHYMPWRDTAPVPQEEVQAELEVERLHEQEILIAGALRRAHLLDLIHNFTIFDDSEGFLIKKVARYQQFRAVHAACDRMAGLPVRIAGQIDDGRGGVVWHTPGSGKSLTMVFLVKKMRTIVGLKRFKVVAVTDRKQLESQLKGVAVLSGEVVQQATGRADLVRKLSQPGAGMLMAMLQKYRPADEVDPGDDELAAFPVCNESSEIVLLVDEAHRGHTKTLHAALIRALPNAAKIAFTGTPILLGDKKRTEEIFGKNLDTYTIKMSEDDGATVPVLYEGRESTYKVKTAEELDVALAAAYPDAEPAELETIRRKHVRVGRALDAPQPITVKAADMLAHYINTVLPDGLKAQVVGSSRIAAARYAVALGTARDSLALSLEAEREKLSAIAEDDLALIDGEEGFRARAFRRLNEIKRLQFAAVISHSHNQQTELDPWSDETTNDQRIRDFKKPLRGPDPAKTSPLAIICVKSMLLTGFDAPVDQALYLDRPMQGAELLQAVSRVNRTASGKHNGLVVDYICLGDKLADALKVYADADVEGVVRSVEDQLPRLEARHERLVKVFTDEGSALDNTDACIDLLADPKVRGLFITALRDFLETLDAVLPRPAALRFVGSAKRFGKIAAVARTIYRDDQLSIIGAGFKVQELIDAHLEATGVDQRIAQISILDANFADEVAKHVSPRTKASQMEHAAKAHLDLRRNEDPTRYRRLSERLQAILNAFADRWDDLAQQLEAFVKEIKDEEAEVEKTGLGPAQRAFWRLLDENRAAGIADEALKTAAGDLTTLVAGEIRRVDFWRTPVAQDVLRASILKLMDDRDLVPYAKLEQVADEMIGVARSQHARLVA